MKRPELYQSYTEDWSADGETLIQLLDLPKDALYGDDLALPFMGPIKLPKGTHAIPFSVRIPFEINPSITYKRKGSARNAAEVEIRQVVSVVGCSSCLG